MNFDPNLIEHCRNEDNLDTCSRSLDSVSFIMAAHMILMEFEVLGLANQK